MVVWVGFRRGCYIHVLDWLLTSSPLGHNSLILSEFITPPLLHSMLVWCLSGRFVFTPVSTCIKVWNRFNNFKQNTLTIGCFIYILDSSNSISFTFWSSQFACSSRSNWTSIWTGNSNGTWTDKQSLISVQQKR